MFDEELAAFRLVMARLRDVCAKGPGEEAVAMYFRLLKPFTFEEVTRGADHWAQSHKFFPQVAEWITSIRAVPKGEPLLELPRGEVGEWLDAERRGFEADPCGCADCVEAGATALPLRFVPTLDRFDAYDRRVLGNREVLRGHWAHGDELIRWHIAREACLVAWRAVAKGHPLREALNSIKAPV